MKIKAFTYIIFVSDATSYLKICMNILKDRINFFQTKLNKLRGLAKINFKWNILTFKAYFDRSKANKSSMIFVQKINKEDLWSRCKI